MEVIMRKIIGICLILCVMFGLNACKKQAEEHLTPAMASNEQEKVEEIPTTIFVYVCGAVNQPGVYELPTESRVYEAIAAAGGLKEDAAVASIHQAEILVDEMTIYIPTLSEEMVLEQESDGKVNINKASKEELMSLPGVGETKATSIIEYRNDHGAFESIEEIKEISGIKDVLYEKIKDLIKI
jgi:competence protein ComEA